jgi:SAM-dependent methyltransferase
MADDTARLASILRQLPRPRRVLEVGCGACPGLAVVAAPGTKPGMLALALDCDLAALRRARRHYPTLNLVQADSARLPFRQRFGLFDLIVARHPDLDRSRAAWQDTFQDIRHWLSDSGMVVVTAYSAPELDLARGWLASGGLVPVPLAVDQLNPPGLSGRDRFALVCRKPG